MAIIGPNGGGKSTLISIILGLEQPDSGTALVFGLPPEKGRINIGYLPQYASHDFAYPITVLEVVMMARLKGRLFKWFNDEDKMAAIAMLKKTNADQLSDRSFRELSGGERQRVLLARALMDDPKLLILDEPSNNLDSHNEYCLYEILETLKGKTSIMMVSHDISAVSRYVNKIACLNKTMHYHGDKELMPKDIEAAYCCHVDLIGHGHAHRHLEGHEHE